MLKVKNHYDLKGSTEVLKITRYDIIHFLLQPKAAGVPLFIYH
jgi:hypothetical protein